MENKKPQVLRALIGILGAGAIVLSIILFSSKNLGLMFQKNISTLFQLDLGLLLVIYGIKERNAKDKSKANIYITVGAVALISTLYNAYVLFTKLAQ